MVLFSVYSVGGGGEGWGFYESRASQTTKLTLGDKFQLIWKFNDLCACANKTLENS